MTLSKKSEFSPRSLILLVGHVYSRINRFVVTDFVFVVRDQWHKEFPIAFHEESGRGSPQRNRLSSFVGAVEIIKHADMRLLRAFSGTGDWILFSRTVSTRILITSNFEFLFRWVIRKCDPSFVREKKLRKDNEKVDWSCSQSLILGHWI